uniref:DNA-binding protein RFX2 n=1 Tax=Denticeps clupeoides TaxID=299321 RepID=A0AAY4DYM9_9TELE
MQSPEAGSDSASTVALRTTTSAQAPVVQPVPASQQRVLVQATGSSQKAAQVQQQTVQRVQQVPQQVHMLTVIRTAYSYNPEAQLYAQTSAAPYFDSQAGSGSHATTVVSSPSSMPSHSMVGVTMDVGSSQIISSGSTYLIHSGGVDSNRHHTLHGSHSARSSTAMLEMAIENLHKSEGIATHKSSLLNSHLQWLLDNYETADGVSLPRCSLYNHYLRHCQEQKLDPVNAASFGKLIRSVFMGLRTRRLGTRGNSKYHYYGIRIKPDSPLNRLQEDTQYMAMRQQPVHQKQRWDSLFLSQSLWILDHCEATLDVVMNLQFHFIEKLWQSFWCSVPSNDGSTTITNSEEEVESVIPREKLLSLCKFEPVKHWMRSCDHILYQALVEILIPDVLRPVPSTLTQAIRNFAKSLEGWLISAMSDFPQEIVRTKVAVVSAFAQTLRRYTSLNHLAQAARAVLQNTSQINQMLADLNRVDFANVQEQASWVCQCDEGVVQRLEQDFKATLQQQSSLDQWAAWLDSVVSQVLKPHEGSPSFPRAARQFLLKWSFYSSMVIRDLTLRSAASFGSFHLIRLLYDEYMFYLVEHRVAKATEETPIAVMGEVGMGVFFMDPSFSDDMSDLGSEGDVSRCAGEPVVKRERIEINHSLQEI